MARRPPRPSRRRGRSARAFVAMWKATTNGNETIPGNFLWLLVTEVRAYAEANSHLDSAEKLLELVTPGLTERDWTQAQVIQLLDAVGYYSAEPIKSCLASAKLTHGWLGTWEGKLNGRMLSLWIGRRAPAVVGITMEMRYPEEASVDDLDYAAASDRAAIDLRLWHEDGKTSPFGHLEPVNEGSLRFIPAGAKTGGPTGQRCHSHPESRSAAHRAPGASCP